MPMNSRRTIYLISGPLGVGKTSLSKKVAKEVRDCARIDGDVLFLALEKVEKISWEKRLEITWSNILSITRKYVENDLDVVIDFVVEGELERFCQNVSDLDVIVKYIVLITDEETIKLRLLKKGEIQYLKRSIVLLKKLQADPANEQYLYDTSNETVSQVVKSILTSGKYKVVPDPVR